MEAGNKVRKTRETDDPDRSKKRKLAAVLEAAPAEGTPPSEAEVEEFFAIVRRMHVAVKYFERTAGGGGGAGGDERGKVWRSALESGVGIAAAADGGDAGEEGAKEERPDAAPAEANGGFDLNAVPEESPGDH
ncbi:AP2/ERF domain-containing protein [Psidium guajava]|nr:AP2/ERF domain-containing protein [Psidium guajava]